MTIRTPLAAVLLAAAFAACNAVPDADRADSRDLTLPWTSDVSSVFNDRAQDNEFQEPPVSPVENATRQLEPDVPSPTPPEPDVPSVSEPTAEGPEPSSAPIDVVRVLLAAGADINAQPADKMTALHFAVRKNDLALAALLLEHGADVSAKESRGRTPLQLAEGRGDEKMVELLLSARSLTRTTPDPASPTPLQT